MTNAENTSSKTALLDLNFMRRISLGMRMNILTFIVAAGFIACGLVIFQGLKVRGDADVISNDHARLAELSRDANIDGLQMRRSEKDFLIRKLEKYLGKYKKGAAKMEAALIEAKTLGLNEADGEIQALQDKLPSHRAQFQVVFDTQKELGLDEKSGLQGKLRKSVHAMEEALTKQVMDKLKVSMLMMRRHEKDFIMRGSSKYVGRMEKRKAEFK